MKLSLFAMAVLSTEGLRLRNKSFSTKKQAVLAKMSSHRSLVKAKNAVKTGDVYDDWVKEIMAWADADGDGKITLDELLTADKDDWDTYAQYYGVDDSNAWNEDQAWWEEWTLDAFEEIDTDGSGSITGKELKAWL